MPLPCPVVDCLFEPFRLAAVPDSSSPQSLRCCPEVEDIVAAMDRAGVRQALVPQCKRWSCERQWLCVDTKLEDVLRLVRQAPDRLAGLAGYNPFAIAESLREVEAAAGSGGFRGIYLNADSFGLTVSDRRVYPMYAKAGELRWPVMVQFGSDSTVAGLLRVAEDFPETALVAVLSRWPGGEVLKQAENLYFALPAALLDEARVAEIGTDRIMWGSQGQDWQEAVSQLMHLQISESCREAFSHATAERVFGLRAPAAIRGLAEGVVAVAER